MPRGKRQKLLPGLSSNENECQVHLCVCAARVCGTCGSTRSQRVSAWPIHSFTPPTGKSPSTDSLPGIVLSAGDGQGDTLSSWGSQSPQRQAVER